MTLYLNKDRRGISSELLDKLYSDASQKWWIVGRVDEFKHAVPLNCGGTGYYIHVHTCMFCNVKYWVPTKDAQHQC